MLFLTDVMRGMAYTLGAFFDQKVTVGSGQGVRCLQAGAPGLVHSSESTI